MICVTADAANRSTISMACGTLKYPGVVVATYDLTFSPRSTAPLWLCVPLYSPPDPWWAEWCVGSSTFLAQQTFIRSSKPCWKRHHANVEARGPFNCPKPYGEESLFSFRKETIGSRNDRTTRPSRPHGSHHFIKGWIHCPRPYGKQQWLAKFFLGALNYGAFERTF